MTGILGILKYMVFERQVRQMLCVDRTIYIYTSPYFRGRQTLGFPSALCLCPDTGKAWLVPAEKKLSDIRYRSMKGLLWDAGQETVSFYYPLVGQLDEQDDDGAFDMERVGASFLTDYEGEIREALIREQRYDTHNMVSYIDCGEQLRDKLIAMLWDVEVIGDKLYGRTDVRIAEPLTPEETEAVKDYILGQNSDGMGEGFEQRPISIDEGDLYVSMWNSGDDYFICSEDELDEHIEQNGGQGFDPM